MDQYFRWNSPYDDLGAMNVQDGSVDYSDFRWGEPVDPIEQDDCVPENPDQGGCFAENSDGDPDHEDYPVVQA